MCFKNVVVFIRVISFLLRSRPFKYRDLVVKGQQRKDRPQKIWYQVMNSDLRSLKVDHELAQNQAEWKIGIKIPV